MIVNCPNCGRALRCDGRLVGKKVRCPACHVPFGVPATLPKGTSMPQHQGARRKPSPQEEDAKCPACGARLDQAIQMCPECGLNLCPAVTPPPGTVMESGTSPLPTAPAELAPRARPRYMLYVVPSAAALTLIGVIIWYFCCARPPGPATPHGGSRVAPGSSQTVAAERAQSDDAEGQSAVSQLRELLGPGQTLRLFTESLPSARIEVLAYSSDPDKEGTTFVKSQRGGHRFYCVVDRDKTVRQFTHLSEDGLHELIRLERSDKRKAEYVHIRPVFDEDGKMTGHRAYVGAPDQICAISIDMLGRITLEFDGITSVIDVSADGEQTQVRWYSEAEAKQAHEEAWMELYLNPVGWYAAVFEGTRPETLYQLKRRQGWRTALSIGQVAGVALIGCVVTGIFWLCRGLVRRWHSDA